MNRRKWCSLAVFVCVLGLLMAGCSSKKEDTAANAPGDKVITWKLQSSATPPEKVFDYPGQYGQAVMLAQAVKERTNGKFDIKVYPAGALFKANEAPDAVKNGAVEMIGSVGAYQSGMIPEALFEYSLPYGTKNAAEGAKVLNDPAYMDVLRKAYAKQNMYLLGLSSISSNNYMTKFPINKLEDLKGKKITAIGSSAQLVAAQEGVAVNLAQAERYTALQRGTVEGAVFPGYGGITYKFFEVCKYQSWPALCTVTACDFVVNMDSWKSLPKEYQDVLQDEMNKLSKYTFEESGPALEKIARTEGEKQFGIKNIDLSDAEFAKFREGSKPVWDSMASKSEGCAQLLKIAKKIANIE